MICDDRSSEVGAVCSRTHCLAYLTFGKSTHVRVNYLRTRQRKSQRSDSQSRGGRIYKALMILSCRNCSNGPHQERTYVRAQNRVSRRLTVLQPKRVLSTPERFDSEVLTVRAPPWKNCHRNRAGAMSIRRCFSAPQRTTDLSPESVRTCAHKIAN